MIVLGALLIFWPLAADATSEDFRYLPGNMELTLSGSATHDENFDGTIMSVEAGLGYFLMEAWEAFIQEFQRCPR